MGNMISIPFKKNFPAFLSSPSDTDSHPALILIHEVWGLTDHIKDITDRFSKEGFVVLAPDLLSETGITEKVDQKIMAEIRDPSTRDEAQKKLRAALVPIQSPEFGKETIEKLKSCIDFLIQSEKVNGKVGVIGFCFGGTYCFALAAEDHRVLASVPFYGHALEPLEKVKNISCPVLSFYGENDHNLVDPLPELEKAMEKYGKDFSFEVYKNTGHAFFNDTNPLTYNQNAAKDAWEKSLVFLKSNL